MAKLPVVSAKNLIKALEKEGFLQLRQKGSHVILQKKDDGQVCTVVVPYHDELAKGTLRSILRKASITPEQLVKLLTVVFGVAPLLQ